MSDARDIVIDLGGAVSKPNDREIARTGARRMVKLIPVPGSYAVPAIWTGPVTPQEIDGKLVLCREAIVLMTKSPPQTMKVTVPADFYAALPEIPVEW